LVVYVVRNLEDAPVNFWLSSDVNIVLNPGYVWSFENDGFIDQNLSLGPLIDSGAIELFSLESSPILAKIEEKNNKKSTNWIKEGF
jgi:hypothetical protein